MKKLYHSLLLLIAGSTQKELASHIRYLKIENEVLRSKLPKRISVSEKERNRLVKFGSKLGKALTLNELVAAMQSLDAVHRSFRPSCIRSAGNRRCDLFVPQGGPLITPYRFDRLPARARG